MTGYMNLFGEPVDLPRHDTKKPKAKRAFVPSHSGWVVKGASPDEYAKKVAEREREIEIIKRSNADPNTKIKKAVPDKLPPFYHWAEKNKTTKTTTKPLSSQSAAVDHKNLAQKNGWLHLEIIELKKGDISQLKGVMPL